MENIYIVVQTVDYDHSFILGVYSTKKAASLRARMIDNKDTVDIHTILLNTDIEIILQ